MYNKDLLKKTLADNAALTETALESWLSEAYSGDTVLAESMRYAVLGGGKRIRAFLAIEFCRLFGGKPEAALPFASAIEMVHAYSLVHDDMPCMDNDDLRRGKPSCHKAFSEDTALLAGDALIGCGIETVANSQKFNTEDKLKAVQLMCAAMGPKGMIYGQELDLKYETVAANKEQLAAIHRNKTGQLISLCGKLGSLGCDLDEKQRNAIDVFFANTGLVFQIVDDILDVESSEEELGKPIGSDAENGKSTFVTLYGLENSKMQVKQLTEEANNLLKVHFGEKAEEIIAYTSKLAERKK